MILPIHIDKELKEKLRKLADKNKTSMSGYIRNLILRELSTGQVCKDI